MPIFTKDQITLVKAKSHYWNNRPEYGNLFNPIQKAEKNHHLMKKHAIGRITDAIQRNFLVTLLAGYHDVNYLILPYLIPNVLLVLDPKHAVSDNLHYGFGSFVTNPLAPLVTGLAIARQDAKKLSKDCKRYLQDDSINRYDVARALLLVPTIPLAVCALLIDFVKMLATYAVILPIMALAAPIAVPVAARRAKYTAIIELLGGEEDYHRMKDDDPAATGERTDPVVEL